MLKVPRCLAPLNKKVKVKGWLTECSRGIHIYIYVCICCLSVPSWNVVKRSWHSLIKMTRNVILLSIHLSSLVNYENKKDSRYTHSNPNRIIREITWRERILTKIFPATFQPRLFINTLSIESIVSRICFEKKKWFGLNSLHENNLTEIIN